jgi:hypothetical protein
MARKGYKEEQIGFALRQAEAGTPVVEICRKMGIAEATFYRWKQRYQGMGVVDGLRVRDICLHHSSCARSACPLLSVEREYSTCVLFV